MNAPLLARRLGLGAVDVACFAACAAATGLIHGGSPGAASAAVAATCVGLVLLLDGYRLDPTRVARIVVMRALLPALAFWAVSAFGTGSPSFSTSSPATTFACLATVLLPLSAKAYLHVLSMSWFGHRILLVGSGPIARQIVGAAARLRPFGICVAGHLAEDDSARESDLSSAPHLGKVNQLEKVLRVFAIDRVVVTLDSARTDAVADVLAAARLSGVRVESGVECSEWLQQRLPIEAPIRQIFLEGRGYEPSRAYEIIKRASDVALAVIGLTIALPVLAVAALAIRLESPGPALFRQVRVGRYGRFFEIFKMRSMEQDAERNGHALAAKNDPRVTDVGRFLRRSRIDELPQLWNVLRGDMTIVGPRPERPEYYDQLADEYPLFRHRLVVRPGLTGWAQVQQGYVGETSGFGTKIAYDLFYVKRRSITLDLNVMWRTLNVLIQLRGV